MSTDKYRIDNTQANAMLTFNPASIDPWTITFQGGSKLMFWRDGRCTFEGNPDEAAKLFFDHVIKEHLHAWSGLPRSK